MIQRQKTLLHQLPFVTLMGALAFGCGNGSSSPDHANTKIDDPSIVDSRGVSEPADSSVTRISLTASAEYDAGSNTVQLFALAKNQVGDPLFVFNKYNFLVTLDSAGFSRNIDKNSSSYLLDVSDGTAFESDSLVCLVLDVSGSMSGEKLAAAKAAATSFIDGMNAGDRTSLVSFSDSARVVEALTSDKDVLNQKINALQVEGATNIGGALQTATGTIGTRPGKRAVILLTDGGDTNDPISDPPGAWVGNPGSTRWRAVLAAQAEDLRVYTIGFGLDPLSDSAALFDLQTIADETGGKMFLAATGADLTTVLQTQIPREIDALESLHTYILSFQNPASYTPGKTVPFLLGLIFGNANGVLSATANGTYIVP